MQELIPIILGCSVWGHMWTGHRIIWHCDNQVVVSCLRSRTSKQPCLMHLICNIVFIGAYGVFCVQPKYIDTHTNHLVDDLSHNRITSFLSKVPTASSAPTPVPVPLAWFLLDTTVDWISLTLDRAWQVPPASHTRQP